MKYYLVVYLQKDGNAEELVFNYAGRLEVIHDLLWQNRQLWNKTNDEYYWIIYHCGDKIEFKEDF